MSVDHISNQDGYHATGASTPLSGWRASAEELEQLQSVFATALTSSLAGVSSGDGALLDAMDAIQENAQERHDMRRQEDRRFSAPNDPSAQMLRKDLDQAEIRSAELRTEYADNFDRRDLNQSQYLDRQQREGERHSTSSENANDKSGVSASAFTPVSIVAAMMQTSSQAASLSTATGVPHSDRSAARDGAATSYPAGPTGASTPNADVLFLSENPSASQVVQANQGVFRIDPMPSHAVIAAASVLTVFNASGKLRVNRDDEADKEKSNEKRKELRERRASSFGAAVFEALKIAEQSEMVRQNNLFHDRPSEMPDENDKAAGPGHGNAVSASFKRSSYETRSDQIDRSEKTDDKAGTKDREPSIVTPPSLPEPASTDQAVARSDSASEASNAEEQLQRFRFVQRIAAACQSAAHRNGNLRVKIDLAELGSLVLRTQMRNDRLSVRFEPTTETAARLISEELGALKDTLAEYNVLLDQVEISMNH